MRINIPDSRLAFPNIWSPRKNTGDDGKISYSYDALLIISPDNPVLVTLDKAFLAAAIEKWEVKGPEILKALKAADRIPLHDGARKAEYAGFEGNMFLSVRSKVRPTIKDKDGVTTLTEADGRPYSGCYVNAIGVEIYGFQHVKFGKRICAQLRGLQFLRDGDAFAAGTPADDNEFGDVSDTGDNDPTA